MLVAEGWHTLNRKLFHGTTQISFSKKENFWILTTLYITLILLSRLLQGQKLSLFHSSLSIPHKHIQTRMCACVHAHTHTQRNTEWILVKDMIKEQNLPSLLRSFVKNEIIRFSEGRECLMLLSPRYLMSTLYTSDTYPFSTTTKTATKCWARIFQTKESVS